MKTTDSILKNKQIDDIKETIKRLESNLLTVQLSKSNNTEETTANISNAVEELNNINKQIESIKEVV